MNDSDTRTATNITTVPDAACAATASAPELRPPLSVEEVATLLGVHRADVMDLVRKGKLAAKRVGSGTFITAANLAAFMAKADPAAAFQRFHRGESVVWMDERGEHGIGQFIAENADGTVRVLREGFWGTYEATFPASQVQAFTCRVPANRVQ